MYLVHVSEKAKKFAEKLSPDYKSTIKARLEELQHTPYPRGCISLEGRPDCYRIRVGPFRIQYSIIEQDNVILVFKISRRDETTYG
ncbi:MAG: type II toxin-antitoxin system RelE/ParE family toxin [Candidatus Micrarchaeota archaeon]